MGIKKKAAFSGLLLLFEIGGTYFFVESATVESAFAQHFAVVSQATTAVESAAGTSVAGALEHAVNTTAMAIRAISFFIWSFVKGLLN